MTNSESFTEVVVLSGHESVMMLSAANELSLLVHSLVQLQMSEAAFILRHWALSCCRQQQEAS